MRDRLLKQTKREYSPNQRLALLAVAGVVFVIILPLALVRLGDRLDRTLGWPALSYPPANAIIGALLIVTGWGCGSCSPRPLTRTAATRWPRAPSWPTWA